MTSPIDELWPKLEGAGEAEVRRRMAIGAYGRDTASVNAWLQKKEREQQSAEQTADFAISRSVKNAAWAAVIVALLSLTVSVVAIVISLRASRGR